MQSPKNNNQNQNVEAGKVHVYDISRGSEVLTHTGELASCLINGIVKGETQTVAQVPVPKKLYTLSTVNQFGASNLVKGLAILTLCHQQAFYASEGVYQNTTLYWILTSIFQPSSQLLGNYGMLQVRDADAVVLNEMFPSASAQDFGLYQSIPNLPTIKPYAVFNPTGFIIGKTPLTKARYAEIFFTASSIGTNTAYSPANFLFYQCINVLNVPGAQTEIVFVRWRDQWVQVGTSGSTLMLISAVPNYSVPDFVMNYSADGSINYLGLLYDDAAYISPPTDQTYVPVDVKLSASIQVSGGNDIYCVHYSDGFFFFTSLAWYTNQNFAYANITPPAVPYPTNLNNSSIVWEVQPQVTVSGTKYTVDTKGVPLVQKCDKVLTDLEVVGQYIFATHQEGIIKFQLILDPNGFPFLKELPSVAIETSIAASRTADVIDNNMFFVTGDNQVKALLTNDKLNLLTLSRPVLPKSPLIQYNSVTSTTLPITTYNFAPNQAVKPLSILGEKMAVIGPYTAINIQRLSGDPQSCKFNYLVSSKILSVNIDLGYQITVPYTMSATSDDGKLFIMEQDICYMPSFYDDSISSNVGVNGNIDYFNPMILIMPMQYFVSNNKNIILDNILITLRLNAISSIFPIGMIVLKDQATYEDFAANWQNDAWWIGENADGLNYILDNPVLDDATNLRCTFVYKANEALTGFGVVLRFGSMNVANNPQYQFYIDKCEIESIVYNIK